MGQMPDLWICPHCRERLTRQAAAWACVNGHSFDVAREGYVNFLAGRQKAGLKGDQPAMLAARRRFLEAGHYEPLRRRLVELVAAAGTRVVAEIGCGEGYYVGGVSEALKVTAYGTDIAKEGLRLAARRYGRVQFAVADTNRLVPLADGSVDVVLDIFAPRNAAEFARVLRPNGVLVVVIPTERHLGELRAVQPLLAIQADKRQAVETGLAPAFELVGAETLAVTLRLGGVSVADLVEMTPNAWFLTAEQREHLAQAGPQVVTAEFEILSFRKRTR